MKKHIYVYSPSGAVRDKAAFRRGVNRLKKLGHEIEIDEAALSSHMRFAGDDRTRLAAIHRAAASGADVALISRGGYGLTRILDQINYKAVAKGIDAGTRFVGFSDFTALSLALLAKTGATTWAGPALCDDFGGSGKTGEPDGHGAVAAECPDDIMEACFDDMVSGQGEGAGWRQLPEDKKNTTLLLAGKALAGKANADFSASKSVLWGGNLAVLGSLVGTPYLPNIKGGILFMEDVAESPYRVERLLSQLLHAGILSRQKAIVLGQFTGYNLTSHDRGFKLKTVVGWLRSQLNIPVLTNLPHGHVMTKVMLPVGAKVDLLVQGRDAMLLWGHAH